MVLPSKGRECVDPKVARKSPSNSRKLGKSEVARSETSMSLVVKCKSQLSSEEATRTVLMVSHRITKHQRPGAEQCVHKISNCHSLVTPES